MNPDSPWLDHLPANSPERQLLAAAEADGPSSQAIDRGWHSLAITVGIATATSVAASTAKAAYATSATIATTPVATSAIGVSLVGKAIAVGFAIGIGVLGTSHVIIERQRESSERTVSAVATAPPGVPRSRPLPAVVGAIAPMPNIATAAGATTLPDATAATEVAPVPAAVLGQSRGDRASTQHVSPQGAQSPLPNSRIETAVSREASLAKQAQELAELKRLLDSGAQDQALTRLQAVVQNHGISALAEDRDALHVEALVRTNHQAEAQEAATRFFDHYPSSLHREKIRHLLARE